MYGTCEQCGAKFKAKPSARRKFCTHACYAESLRTQRRGEGNPSWRGGISYSEHGYRLILVGNGEPMANNNGYVPEHRLVMSKHLGRSLSRDEHVHHRNGDILDNRIENLELLSLGQHTSHHNRRKSRKLDRFSFKHDACIDCGASDRKHAGRGLCTRCYDRQRKRSVAE